MPRPASLTRDVPLGGEDSVLLVVDVQNQFCVRGFDGAAGDGADDYYWGRVEGILMPRLEQLLGAARKGGIEVMYTVIQALTRDGRDRSLDHKLSGFLIPRDSPGALMPASVAPTGDEMVLPKTSSGVFNSTNIDYVLRNLGCRNLIVAGVYTHQCVESAVRDAADRGYLTTVAEDACAARSEDGHKASIAVMKGYARIMSVSEIVAQMPSARTRSRDGQERCAKP